MNAPLDLEKLLVEYIKNITLLQIFVFMEKQWVMVMR